MMPSAFDMFVDKLLVSSFRRFAAFSALLAVLGVIGIYLLLDYAPTCVINGVGIPGALCFDHGN